MGGAEHLISLPKMGLGTLLSVSAANHERTPTVSYSDLMPSKQIIGQTITYNGTTSGFEVKS